MGRPLSDLMGPGGGGIGRPVVGETGRPSKLPRSRGARGAGRNSLPPRGCDACSPPCEAGRVLVSRESSALSRADSAAITLARSSRAGELGAGEGVGALAGASETFGASTGAAGAGEDSAGAEGA